MVYVFWLIELGQKYMFVFRIPYFISATKQYPGKFLLAYMPRTKPRNEYVTITPDGYKYRQKKFHSLNSMMRYFKEHFRDPIAGTPHSRTPMVGQTPSGFNLQGIVALNCFYMHVYFFTFVCNEKHQMVKKHTVVSLILSNNLFSYIQIRCGCSYNTACRGRSA